jgi:hypothetical protein
MNDVLSTKVCKMNNPTYDEIVSAITNSSREEWIEVGDITGGGSAVFRPDPRISITASVDAEDRAYSESWANVHADSSASRVLVSVRFGGQVIREDVGVAVDGGRATLIAPDIIGNEPGNYTWGYDEGQYAWASAVGGVLNAPGQFEDYVGRSGLGTPSREPRVFQGARERSNQ